MIAEFRRSIESILYQRVTSPFYGTLVTAWVIWNWRIWYLTLFIDSERLPANKIEYILKNYNDINTLVLYPLVSTILLLTVLPFVVNGAYWIDLKFKTWRINQKLKIEGKQLLTLEKSIQLRNEVSEQEERFDKLLEKKNEEIEILKRQIEEIRTQEIPNKNRDKQDKANSDKTALGTSYSSSDYDLLQETKEAYNVFETVVKSLKGSSRN